MSAANNPYSPPKSDPGSDPTSGQAMVRPRAVDIAVVLIVIQLLLTVFDALESWGKVQNGEITGLLFLELWVRIGLLVWIVFAIPRGRNWARIVLLVLTLLALYSMGVGLMAMQRMGMHIAYLDIAPGWSFMLVLPSLSYIASCYLVFIPGRSWFVKRPG
jgi:hypothetical protein